MTDTGKQKQLLLGADFIRILITIFILSLNIPDFVKIVLIMASDAIDCGIPDLFMNDWIDCWKSSMFYQKMDKITDTISYGLLLLYLLQQKYVNSAYGLILIVLFIFRIIGISFFLQKGERQHLFYFPNFFLEICLGIAIIYYFPSLNYYKYIILFGIIIYKLIQEYYLHIYLPSKSVIKK